MAILQIENLSFKYPEAEFFALKNISFTLNSGDFAVICGESGCGKSTLLRLIKKELSPYGEKNGEILYLGSPLEKIDDRVSASEIAMVSQSPEGQLVTASVYSELAFGLESLGTDMQAMHRRISEAVSYFGIESWFHKKNSELSGGQKQLLNLACATVSAPKLLLLDEPCAQLDPIAAVNLMETLKRLNREFGITVLMAEHRLEDAFPLADKVLLMEHGQLSFNGTPQSAGEYLSRNREKPLFSALPAAMQIYGMLEAGGTDFPLSVRDGRRYVTENYGNEYNTVVCPQYSRHTEKALLLHNICFRYEKNLPDILKHTSLSVMRGEHFCILGGNGSGKTTLLGVAAGILRPYSGSLIIRGKKITKYTRATAFENKVALLVQNPRDLFIEKTLQEELYESCRTMQYTEAESENEISEIAERLGIKHLLSAHPYDLSGGEQQRAALAKLLLLKPEILLLDEPTKGLDPYFKTELIKLLSELKACGVALITVTHDIEFAAAAADRVGMLFDGELTAVGEPYEFFCENSFYTTAANRISRGHFKNALLCEQVAELCLKNGKRAVKI